MAVNLPPIPNEPVGETHQWRNWFTRIRQFSQENSTSWGGGTIGVASFNGRVGITTLTYTDVTTALTFTPATSSHTHTGVYEPANTNIQTHIGSTSNPHAVTKTQVGLGNVDDTSDVNKPVSTAQATAIGLKISSTEKGAANGVATLDAGSKIPLSQLPTISASVTGTEIELDFGTVHTRTKTFTITDASVSSTTLILMTVSGNAPTGRSADEVTMEGFTLSCIPTTGSFDVTVSSLLGPVTGKYKFNYIRT